MRVGLFQVRRGLGAFLFFGGLLGVWRRALVWLLLSVEFLLRERLSLLRRLLRASASLVCTQRPRATQSIWLLPTSSVEFAAAATREFGRLVRIIPRFLASATSARRGQLLLLLLLLLSRRPFATISSIFVPLGANASNVFYLRNFLEFLANPHLTHAFEIKCFVDNSAREMVTNKLFVIQSGHAFTVLVFRNYLTLFCNLQ